APAEVPRRAPIETRARNTVTNAERTMASEKTGHQHTPEEESRIREAALDKTIADSFPASDPPSSDPNPDDHSAIEREGPGDASSWSRAFRAMFEAELFARFTWVSIVRR